jgi:hypothetical protein
MIPENDDDLDFEQTNEEYVPDEEVIAITTQSAGHKCVKCGDFYQYAEINRQNGTFKCWGCRH